MPFVEKELGPPPHMFWAGRNTGMLPMDAAHVHSQVEINLMLCGEATYAFGGHRVTVRADDFVLFWGAVPHQVLSTAEATRFVCLYLPIEMFLALKLSAMLRECVLAGGMIASHEPLAGDWPQRLHGELLSGDAQLAELSRLEIELHLRRLDLSGWTDRAGVDANAVGRHGGPHAKVCAMAQFLTSNATGPVTAAAVGAVVGLHPNYAMTLFKGALGMTLGEYLTRYRLYLAQSMLLAGGRDVTSIAFDSGFGSVSRFHEAFRRRFGISPHRFRRSASRTDDRRGRRAGEAG